ncbi:MAG TPA: diguanylate cyclase [Gaiellaceae bacterium]|jgi:diguanylate cyclase (GGDEF)-like protein
MEAAAHSRPPAVPRVWQAILVAGLAVLGLHYLGHVAEGGSRLYETWFYEGLELFAALGCIARAVLVRAERSAWLFIGAALLATTCGDVLYDFWYGGNPPFPSAADVAYLAFYPLLYVGIALLLRRRVSTFSASLWLDGLVAAAAAAALGASVLVEVVVNSTQGSRLVVVTNMAYPIGDVLLLALVVFVFSVLRWRPGRAWALIAAGLLLNVAGDAVYLYQVAVGTYVEGTYLDLAWPLSVVLIALAAWQRPGRASRVQLENRALLGTPIVCGLVGTGVLVAATQLPVHPIALLLATITIVLVLARTALSFWENARLLEASRHEALTDSLTGLANRRKLLVDLDAALEAARDDEPCMLVLFDLNGFKTYNDTFGHPAGDALLARLATKLAATVEPAGAAYRMGGDEFCVLLPEPEPDIHRIAQALWESGEGFDVTSAYGTAVIPDDATTVSTALSVADERLYAHKELLAEIRRGTAHEPLLRTLAEREPELRAHVADVASLAVRVGQQLGLAPDELEELRLAAELHDVGKLAIPDAVLQKSGLLDPTEWGFVHSHTLIGQRILGAAPALRPVGAIVRSTHENWDGTGYPDGLAGEAIPLAARIIGVCDAYSAITSDRPYRAARTPAEAVGELRRCAGGQFDAQVVELLCMVLADEDEPATTFAVGT